MHDQFVPSGHCFTWMDSFLFTSSCHHLVCFIPFSWCLFSSLSFLSTIFLEINLLPAYLQSSLSCYASHIHFLLIQEMLLWCLLVFDEHLSVDLETGRGKDFAYTCLCTLMYVCMYCTHPCPVDSPQLLERLGPDVRRLHWFAEHGSFGPWNQRTHHQTAVNWKHKPLLSDQWT